MKYTTERRHEIYKNALKLFDTHGSLISGHVGLCCALRIISNNYESYDSPEYSFPEFWLFGDGTDIFFNWCPQFYNLNEWEKIELRKIVLMFAIEMTKP